MEDNPAQLSELIAGFVREPVRGGVTRTSAAFVALHEAGRRPDTLSGPWRATWPRRAAHPAAAPPSRGIAGFHAQFKRLFGAIPDLTGEVHRWEPTPDGVTIDMTFHGTLSGAASPCPTPTGSCCATVCSRSATRTSTRWPCSESAIARRVARGATKFGAYRKRA